jgi:hypothetical protein
MFCHGIVGFVDKGSEAQHATKDHTTDQLNARIALLPVAIRSQAAVQMCDTGRISCAF